VALKGSLNDLAIVDLIQLLNRVNQTGALVLSDDGQRAWLYYQKGQLVDARTGDRRGMEALVEIVDWGSGNFEFEPGVAPQGETIQMDLHRVIMHALKIRDERKEEERRKAEAASQARTLQNAALNEELAKAVNGTEFVLYAGLADASGAVLAETRSAKAPPTIDKLRDWLLRMATSHPGGDLIRMFLENEIGAAVIARAGSERIAVVVAEKGPSFGAVSLWAGKLVARFTARPAPQVEQAVGQ